MPEFDSFVSYPRNNTYLTLGCYLPTLIPAFIDNRNHLLGTSSVSETIYQALYKHCLIELSLVILYNYLHFIEERRPKEI